MRIPIPTTPASATRTARSAAPRTPEDRFTPVKPAALQTPASSTSTSISAGSSSSHSPLASGRKLRLRQGQEQQEANHTLVTADDWYDQGERVWYDPVEKNIVAVPTGPSSSCSGSTPSYPECLVEVDCDDGHAEEVGGEEPALATEIKEEEKEQENIIANSGDGRSSRLVKVFFRVVLPNKEEETREDDEANKGLPACCCSPTNTSSKNRWMTFLPGDPEGSYGFHQIEEALSCSALRTRSDTEETDMSADSVNDGATCYRRCDTSGTTSTTSAGACTKKLEDGSGLARLYLDYLGQGDSDSYSLNHPASSTNPEADGENHVNNSPLVDDSPNITRAVNEIIKKNTDKIHSITKQRADLVEAHWKAQGILRTVVVSVGASSLVVMELLQRQRARLAAGDPFPKILHVLSLNGRYVAKTRHTSQLPTVTQILRSERMGPSLAAKAQRSDFTLSQCLQPYLKGCRSKHARKQVAEVVRRHNGASSLVDMARTVDDHLQDAHKYLWNLPRIFKVFGMNQGITLQLVTTNRMAQRQVHLVQQQMEEYCNENENYSGADDDHYHRHVDDDSDRHLNVVDIRESFPGLRHETLKERYHVTSTSFLLDSNQRQLDPFLKAIQRLANEKIPMSDNSAAFHLHQESFFTTHNSFEEENHDDDHDEDNDSWQGSAGEGHYDEDLEASQDTRLQTEIVFDANLVDDDDFEMF